MKRVKVWLVAGFLVLTALWLLADTLLPEPLTYFSFRAVFVQYSGIICMGAMSVAMMLSLRPKWLEPHLGGLDKMYLLHKWLGILALVVGIIHWWWAQGTKWMVGWGWLAKPQRPQRGALPPGIEGLLLSQRGFAEWVGELAFYAAVILIVVALVRRIPYHWFVKTHKLFSVAYLALVYHALVLTKLEYWSQPVGWVLGALLAGGSVAAVVALAGRIGASRKVTGTIEELTYFAPLRVLETSVKLRAGWPGHAAGQFAFVTSDKNEKAHPYTIASAWNPADPRIVFITKELGDYTKRLPELWKTGMAVTVEGPYGCFDFRDGAKRQIWVGGGIGITPFIARLQQLAAEPKPEGAPGAEAPRERPIDLFHSTMDYDEEAIRRLTASSEAAGVRLHVLVDERDGLLTGERIRQAVPEWKEASVWFCGPPGFGQALRRDLVAEGLPADRFHQELFQMR